MVRQFRFDCVAFEFRPGVAVVKDFSLSVPGGSIVALVGPSGAGKTTVTDLVARFQDPTAGSITLNGIDLRDLQLASYRGLLAVCRRTFFSSTARSATISPTADATPPNRPSSTPPAGPMLMASSPSCPKATTRSSATRLQAFRRPRQRLSIARAILADPQILILDEATSNLDTESEQLIQSALSELLKSRTTFVIAHRLSTVTHADIIVAMEAGQIREVGTHEELMDRRGFYAEMVDRQRKTFEGAESLLTTEASARRIEEDAVQLIRHERRATGIPARQDRFLSRQLDRRAGRKSILAFKNARRAIAPPNSYANTFMATTPLLPDFKEFLKLLTSNGVEYMLVGGYAVIYYGYTRSTVNMDVWIAVNPANARRVADTVKQFGFAGGVKRKYVPPAGKDISHGHAADQD